MGQVRCKLSALPMRGSFFQIDIAPQIAYDALIHSEGALTTFVNSCAQAGAVKCLLVRMIKEKATGSDVRMLITSTIDVSLSTPVYVSC